MIRNIALLLVIIITIPSLVMAQDSYNEPEKANIGILEPTTSNKITKKMANNFFEGCLDTPYDGLTIDERGAFCACSSAGLYANMKLDEYNRLSQEKTKDAYYLESYHKMMTKVFLPCLSDPFYNKQLKICLRKKAPQEIRNNDKIPSYVTGLCECTAEYIRNYIDEFGAYDIIETIKTNTKEKDPVRALYRSKEVELQLSRGNEVCKRKIFQQTRN